MKYNIGIVVLTKGLKKDDRGWHSELDATLNLIAAIRRYKRYKRDGLNSFLVLSGGRIDSSQPILSEVMYQETVSSIPEEDIFLENKSIDTSENAEFSKPIITENLMSEGKLEVITNHYHLKRSKACFEIYGLSPTMVSSESELISLYPEQIKDYLQTQRIKEKYKLNTLYYFALKLVGPRLFRWHLHRTIKKKGRREP